MPVFWHKQRAGNIVVEKRANCYYDIDDVTVCSSNRWMKRFLLI